MTTSPLGSTTPSQGLPSAEPYYRPQLIGAIAACVGIVVGSLGPWATVMLFTINGLDASGWGITTSILGAASCVGLVFALYWTRTPPHLRWSLPLAWAVSVAGVACLTLALPLTVRILASPKTNFLGITIGPAVGWGLWLLTVSSAALSVSMVIVAAQMTKRIESIPPQGQSADPLTNGSRWAAIIASAIIVLSGIVYFSLNWNGTLAAGGHSSSEMSSMPSFPSFTMPSFPSYPSFSTPSEPETTTEPTTTPIEAPIETVQPTAAGSGPTRGEPCSDIDKLDYDRNAGENLGLIVCGFNTSGPTAKPLWVDASSLPSGNYVAGTPCSGMPQSTPYRSNDGYMIMCSTDDNGTAYEPGGVKITGVQGPIWQLFSS